MTNTIFFAGTNSRCLDCGNAITMVDHVCPAAMVSKDVVDDLKKQITELKAALARYGMHDTKCRASPHDYTCHCGLGDIKGK